MIYHCPKCAKEMTKGHLEGAGLPVETLANWIEGKPKHSLRVQIDTFRCGDCGYLEWYARKSKTGPNERTFTNSPFKQGGF